MGYQREADNAVVAAAAILIVGVVLLAAGIGVGAWLLIR